MKKSAVVILSIIFLSLSIVNLNSCKEPCEDYCVNGYCLTGDCDCKLGWMGEACDEVDPNYNPGNTTSGFVSFFQKVDIDCGPVKVDITKDGQLVNTANTTQFFPNGIVECGLDGCANFNLLKGAYAYLATDTCGTTWTDSLSIGVKSCDRIILN